MNENNNIIENGIRLQDGRIILGYPKQDPVVEEDKETPVLVSMWQMDRVVGIWRS